MLPRLASTLVDLAVAVQQERLTYSSEFARAACVCSPYLLIRCTSDANLSSIDAAIESTYAADSDRRVAEEKESEEIKRGGRGGGGSRFR